MPITFTSEHLINSIGMLKGKPWVSDKHKDFAMKLCLNVKLDGGTEELQLNMLAINSIPPSEINSISIDNFTTLADLTDYINGDI